MIPVTDPDIIAQLDSPSAEPDSYERALAGVIGKEGGYANHPADRGGETIFGVSSRYFPEDVETLKTMAMAGDQAGVNAHLKEFYRKNFWDQINTEGMAQDTAYAAFDTAVHHGVDTAKKLLEQSNGDAKALLKARQDYINGIIESDPTQQEFAQGWNNRLNTLSQELSGLEPPAQGELIAGGSDNENLRGSDGDDLTADRLTPVTDPDLIKQLEGLKPVTDPDLIAALESGPVERGGDFARGVKMGLQSVPETMGATAEAAGYLTNIKKGGDQPVTRRPENADRIQPKFGGFGPAFQQGKGVVGKARNILDQAQETLGQNIAPMLPSIGLGTAGGIAGGAAAGPPGAAAGALGGAFLGSQSQIPGEFFIELQNAAAEYNEANPEKPLTYDDIAGAAMLYGTPAAMLDALPPGKAVMDIAGNLTSDAMQMSAKEIIKRIAAKSGKTAAVEGSTETLQEGAKIGAVSDQTKSPFFTPESGAQILEATAAGTLGGTTLGAGEQSVSEGANLLKRRGDPEIIESGDLTPVTDPDMIKQLEAAPADQDSTPDTTAQPEHPAAQDNRAAPRKAQTPQGETEFPDARHHDLYIYGRDHAGKDTPEAQEMAERLIKEWDGIPIIGDEGDHFITDKAKLDEIAQQYADPEESTGHYIVEPDELQGYMQNQIRQAAGTATQPESPAMAKPLKKAKESGKIAENLQKTGTDTDTTEIDIAADTDRPAPSVQKLVTPRGDQEIEAAFDVVEADSLITSDDERFPQVLQPRDRSRAASDLQILDIANTLDPQRLADSRTTDTGAPLVGPDNIVESGNGRTMGIRMAYQKGLPSAEKYRAFLQSRGYDVTGMKAPVLVQRRRTELSPEDRVKFTIASNEPVGAAMGTTERAMADAKNISDDMASLYEGGDVDAAANRRFIKSFMETVAPNERGRMIGKDGTLSQDGIRRLRAGLLAKAYSDADIVSSLMEDADTEIKGIGNAMTSIAGKVAAFRAAVAKGDTPQELDITDKFVDAAKRIRDARANGKPVSDILSQGAMFEDQRLDPVTEAIIRAIYTENLKRPLSAQKIEAFMRKYYEEAAKAEAGPGLMGLDPVKPQDIIAIARPKDRTEPEQGDLISAARLAEVGAKIKESVGKAKSAKPSNPYLSDKDRENAIARLEKQAKKAGLPSGMAREAAEYGASEGEIREAIQEGEDALEGLAYQYSQRMQGRKQGFGPRGVTPESEEAKRPAPSKSEKLRRRLTSETKAAGRSGIDLERAEAFADLMASAYKNLLGKAGQNSELAAIIERNMGEGLSIEGAATEQGRMYAQDQTESLPFTTEQTEVGEQMVIPGAERVSQAELDRKTLEKRAAEEKQRAKKDQKALDFGLFDDQRTLFQSDNQTADGLRSALLGAADALKQDKGAGDQMLAMLRKTAGVKEDEIAWTGLDEYLKGKKAVTKQEIVDYLEQNQVRIKEVVLGSRTLLTQIERDKLKEYEDYLQQSGAELPEAVRADYERLNALVDQEFALHNEGGTRYSKYTLPGGTNYREVLLTLPTNESKKQAAKEARLSELQRRLTDLRNEREDETDFTLTTDGDTAERRARIEDLARQIDNTEMQIRMVERETDDRSAFYSSHFDQPNILAHVRLSDRVDAQGRKVLLVEEIQSDWHQAGRKRGYKKEGDLSDDDVRDFFDLSREFWDEADAAERAAFRQDAIQQGATKGVPDAPFKKTWHEMALRRIAQMAAQNGYDAVAWTPGEVQAERYDLSKQVDRIIVGRTRSGLYYEAVTPDGKSTGPKAVKDENALADNIGKELAERAIKELEDTNRVSYSGIDLEVGGEGMKGFYDKMLPSYAKKFAKKYGGDVAPTRLVTDKVGNDGTRASQTAFGLHEVLSMAITPAMRAAANKGFELFQAQNKGSVTFLPDGRTIISLFERADASTLVHEAGHIFLNTLQQLANHEAATPGIQQDWNVIKGWLGIKDGTIITTEQHEKFARGFERYMREGKAPTAALRRLFTKFKTWLTEIYKAVGELDVQITPEVRSVFDRMIAGEAVDLAVPAAAPKKRRAASGGSRGEAGINPIEAAVLEAAQDRPPPDGDMDNILKTRRASFSNMIWADAGIDTDKAQRYSLQKRFKIAKEQMRKTFGIKVEMGKGAQTRHAVDTIRDIYAGLKAMAYLNGMPEKAVGLENIRITPDGELIKDTLRLAFTKDNRRGFLGVYLPGEHKIAIKGRNNIFAHEWMHAVDYTVLRAMGEETDAMGKRFRGYSGKIRRAGEPSFEPGSVEEAWINLMNTIFFDEAFAAAKIMQLENKIAKTSSEKVKATARDQIARIKAGKWQGRDYRSPFYRQAKSIPAKSDSGYWTRPTEMVSRAYEAYMAQKLKDAGLPSDIMTFGGGVYEADSGPFHKLYPHGTDRDRIFLAFEKMFQAITMADVMNTGNLDPAQMPVDSRTDPLTMVKKADMRRAPKGVRAVLKRDADFIKDALHDLINNERRALKKQTLQSAKMRRARSLNEYANNIKASALERQTLGKLVRNPDRVIKPARMTPGRFDALKQAAREINDAADLPIDTQAFIDHLNNARMIAFSSEKTMLHVLESRNPKSLAMSDKIAKSAPSPGKGVPSANNYISRRREVSQKYGNRLGAMISEFDLGRGNRKLKRLESRTLRDLYFHPDTAQKPAAMEQERFDELAAAATELSRIIEDLRYEYERNVPADDLGETIDTPYLRRIYDKSRIWKRKREFQDAAAEVYLIKYGKDIGAPDDLDAAAFIALAEEVGMGGNQGIKDLRAQVKDAREAEDYDPAEPVRLAVDPELYAAITSDAARKDASDWWMMMFTDPEFSPTGAPSGFKKARVLPAEADDLLADFMVADPVESTMALIDGMADHIAWRSLIEPKEGDLRRAVTSAIETGWDYDDANIAAEIIRTAANRSDKSKNMGRGVAALMNGFHTAWTAVIMARAVYASLSEPFVYALRTGHLGGTGTVWKNLVASVVNTKDAQEKRRIFQAWGMIENRLTSSMMAERTGGLFEESPKLQRVMNRYFENTLLSPLTRRQREAVMSTLPIWFRILAEDATSTGTKKSARLKRAGAIDELVEAGIPKDRIEDFATYVIGLDGALPDVDSSFMPDSLPLMYMRAISYAADHIIQNPSVIDRPKLANNPAGRFVYGLMSFAFAYFDNVVKRIGTNIAKEYQRGGTVPAAKLVVGRYLPAYAMLYAMATTAFFLRTALFNHGRLEELDEEDELLQYLALGGFAYTTVLGPIGDLLINMVTGVKYNKDLANYFVGAQMSLPLQILQWTLGFFANNSDTNTAERHMVEALYRLGVSLPSSLAVGAFPGGSIIGTSWGIANMYIASRGAERAAATAIVGEPDTVRSWRGNRRPNNRGERSGSARGER